MRTGGRGLGGLMRGLVGLTAEAGVIPFLKLGNTGLNTIGAEVDVTVADLSAEPVPGGIFREFRAGDVERVTGGAQFDQLIVDIDLGPAPVLRAFKFTALKHALVILVAVIKLDHFSVVREGGNVTGDNAHLDRTLRHCLVKVCWNYSKWFAQSASAFKTLRVLGLVSLISQILQNLKYLLDHSAPS